jgi:hypothetical protein
MEDKIKSLESDAKVTNIKKLSLALEISLEPKSF